MKISQWSSKECQRQWK